jgi:glycosyltransferase involved in cell wall biosynthesis
MPWFAPRPRSWKAPWRGPTDVRPLAILHTENSCGWGGQEIRILTESRGMLDRGHRVTLVTPAQAPIAEAARRIGIPVVTMPLRKRVGDILALRRLLRERRAQIDVLNSHSSTDSWLGALACATLGDPPPIVRTRHVSTTVHDRAGTRWLYRKGNAHIVTTGEAIRRQLHESIGVPLEKMTSIPTGIDLARFVPGDSRAERARLALPDRPALGIVATMRSWKGHTFLFDALALHRNAWDGWQVLVIGGGPDREALEGYVRRLGLDGFVRFTGHKDDVVPWIRSLDLFTLPSSGDEGVPQAILQAMACGLAVVATTVGAIPEVVEDGVTGLLVRPRSSEALAEALARLRDDAPQRAQLGAAARRRAEKDFGIDQMLDRMEAVFRSVAGR